MRSSIISLTVGWMTNSTPDMAPNQLNIVLKIFPLVNNLTSVTAVAITNIGIINQL